MVVPGVAGFVPGLPRLRGEFPGVRLEGAVTLHRAEIVVAPVARFTGMGLFRIDVHTAYGIGDFHCSVLLSLQRVGGVRPAKLHDKSAM